MNNVDTTVTRPHLPLDVFRMIAAYSSDDPSTLASLDVTCREMRQHTDAAWALLAQKRFGNSDDEPELNGKESWKAGIAFSRTPQPPITLWQPDEEAYFLARVASGERIMAVAQTVTVHQDSLQYLFQIRDCHTAQILEERKCETGRICCVCIDSLWESRR